MILKLAINLLEYSSFIIISKKFKNLLDIMPCNYS